jgi:carboxypeptidase Q
MKRFLLALPVLMASTSIWAQTESVDTAMMQKIRAEETQHSLVPEIAHQLTDMAGPRLTGTPGYDRAASWAVQELKSWGLNAWPETWGVFGKGWETEHAYFALSAPYYQPMIGYPRAWTPGTNGLVKGKVVVLDVLDSASIEKAGSSLKGAVVILKTIQQSIPIPLKPDARRWSADTLNKLPDADMVARGLIPFYANYLKKEYKVKKLLASKGALALLESSPDDRDGTIYVDGPWVQARQAYPAYLPEAMLSREDYLRLQRMALGSKAPEVELDINNKWQSKDQDGYNVIGEIPGSDPQLKTQVVMLGGHLDSWIASTGATDNGAGCIVMMEAVRILKALGIQPKRTIRIALWSGEEEGLLGSFGYVKRHFGDPADMKLTPEAQSISAYFNLDNGTGKIRGIYCQNNASVKPIFTAWLAPFADLDATGVTMSNTGSTDHLSFDAVGIPAFQFIQDPLDYESRTHHTNMDSYEHLSIDDLEQASILVAAFVYNTAMRPGLLPRKPAPAPEKFIFDLTGLF